MGNRFDTKIILGSLRYKSAPDVDTSLTVPFKQTFKENVEFDRSADVSLAQIYDDERQKSDIFRPSCKVSLIFKNSFAGTTKYLPFKNSLYYINLKSLYKNICTVPLTNVTYSGYPQYNEFDFMRNDYEFSGYTTPDQNNTYHIKFKQKNYTSYNWGFYLSYPYENVYNKQLQALETKSKQVLTWNVSDGIPFIIDRAQLGGLNLISFRCPIKHGISAGEFIKLSFNYNGTDLFLVQSLGDGFYGSDEYVLNIIDVGYLEPTFNIGNTGTLKRVIDNQNIDDTISTYYIVNHKILTKNTDYVLTKTGFEQLIFNKVKQNEDPNLTPNKIRRTSIKEDNKTYTLSFDKDIKINELRDNLDRPITELYFTFIWSGYFGWTLGGVDRVKNKPYGLKQGYDFNIQYDLGPNQQPSTWWKKDNPNSDVNLSVSEYSIPPNDKPFYYVNHLTDGDMVEGGYYEWNKYLLTERKISDNYHKFTFNPNYFRIFGLISGSEFNNNPKGYYYQPHHPIKLRDYSNYVETSEKPDVLNVPYLFYSSSNRLYQWRDIYSYGYIDENGVGVDYPFFNGCHYPYTNIVFRLIPEGSNYVENNVVGTVTKDDCE
jgi:hypothetical protein